MQPTANKEYLWRPEGRAEAAAKIKAAKIKKGITYKDLARGFRRQARPGWPAPSMPASGPAGICGQDRPGSWVFRLPTSLYDRASYKGYADPILYRLHEVFDTFGPALKELIHEEFGNAIMSAIDFKVDVERRPDPKGDRIIITFDGKCLPYSLAGKYPW